MKPVGTNARLPVTMCFEHGGHDRSAVTEFGTRAVRKRSDSPGCRTRRMEGCGLNSATVRLASNLLGVAEDLTRTPSS